MTLEDSNEEKYRLEIRTAKDFPLLLVVLMILSPVCGLTAFAGALGDSLHTKSLYIGNETMANGIYWNSSASDKVTENYIVYEPGSAGVIPIIAYGNDIYGAASLQLRRQRRRNSAAGRSSPGSTATISRWQMAFRRALRSKTGCFIPSETPSYPSLGFYEDGTAIIGSPALNIKLSGTSLTTQITSLHLNKVMTTACVWSCTPMNSAMTTRIKLQYRLITFSFRWRTHEIEMNGTLSELFTHGRRGDRIDKDSFRYGAAFDGDRHKLYVYPESTEGHEGRPVTLDFTANEAWNDVTHGIVKRKL